MNARHLIACFTVVLVCGCAAGVNVDPMIQDFDDYERDLKAVATDARSLETLEKGREKRDEAGALVEQGKEAEAVPVVERALADARLALEMNRLDASTQRAEQCRVEVEQARVKWKEALFVLEQTEKFVDQKATVSKQEPQSPHEEVVAPASTLEPDSFPPSDFSVVTEQWIAWRHLASEEKVPAADLENTFRRGQAAVLAEKVKPETVQQETYIAGRAAQALECRVRAHVAESVCLESTQMTAELGNGREDLLRATLELERGLQANLRGELDRLRAEAKTRQDELYDALSQMQGKFAMIRRDARGTIVSLADILFDFDKATLKRDVEFNLVKIATILNQFGEMNILIEGHTDNVGTEEYNLELSKRRAQAVYEFLLSQDVAEDRMTWDGYGESRPVADNNTEEGRQRNRRVDLVIQDAP